ncbi:Protein of unknown function DUF3128 [Lasallia pustulata]|uniref:Early meiotic induction protein 1 n=1 Tax=Lasallia pustulata TaxID=136370 RepID=A0A1W5DDT1_9LECA|nr:Protein of unknown function DUF3128 [Lasallia pustulata]
MGWWWSSAGEAESHSTSHSTPTPNHTDTKLTIPSSQTASPSPDTATDTPRTLTRDEQADADLQSLLRELQSETQSTSTSHAASPTTTSPPPSPTSIAPSSLYPTTISCRAAFDSAFYCQSLGGQFMNLYRYGSVRNCSDQWTNFWFCMRTNRGMMSDEERMRRVQDHYRQRAVKYKVGPSSEDVWEVRMERLEGAFEGDLERLEREEVERKRQGAGSDW